MGYVYLIGSEQFGWYKIGKAKSPEVRLDQLGILLPFKVEVFGIWESNNYSELERIAHRLHGENRINGEWFSFSPAERQHVIRKISGWDAKLIFPTGLVLAKPIRASNIAKNVVQPIDEARSRKKMQKYAAFNAYILENGIDKDDQEAVAQAWRIVLAQIKAETKALSA